MSSSFARRSGVNTNGGPSSAILRSDFWNRAAVVHHQRMETHRSTSPMTTSVEPMTAMTSAIMPPTISLGSPWHA